MNASVQTRTGRNLSGWRANWHSGVFWRRGNPDPRPRTPLTHPPHIGILRPAQSRSKSTPFLASGTFRMRSLGASERRGMTSASSPRSSPSFPSRRKMLNARRHTAQNSHLSSRPKRRSASGLRSQPQYRSGEAVRRRRGFGRSAGGSENCGYLRRGSRLWGRPPSRGTQISPSKYRPFEVRPRRFASHWHRSSSPRK